MKKRVLITSLIVFLLIIPVIWAYTVNDIFSVEGLKNNKGIEGVACLGKPLPIDEFRVGSEERITPTGTKYYCCQKTRIINPFLLASFDLSTDYLTPYINKGNINVYYKKNISKIIDYYTGLKAVNYQVWSKGFSLKTLNKYESEEILVCSEKALINEKKKWGIKLNVWFSTYDKDPIYNPSMTNIFHPNLTGNPNFQGQNSTNHLLTNNTLTMTFTSNYSDYCYNNDCIANESLSEVWRFNNSLIGVNGTGINTGGGADLYSTGVFGNFALNNSLPNGKGGTFNITINSSNPVDFSNLAEFGWGGWINKRDVYYETIVGINIVSDDTPDTILAVRETPSNRVDCGYVNTTNNINSANHVFSGSHLNEWIFVYCNINTTHICAYFNDEAPTCAEKGGSHVSVAANKWTGFWNGVSGAGGLADQFNITLDELQFRKVSINSANITQLYYDGLHKTKPYLFENNQSICNFNIQNSSGTFNIKSQTLGQNITTCTLSSTDTTQFLNNNNVTGNITPSNSFEAGKDFVVGITVQLVSLPPPNINNNTWIVNNAYNNQTNWRNSPQGLVLTRNTLVNVTFNTDTNSNCRIGNTNNNYTGLGSTRNCELGDASANHTCTSIVGDSLIFGNNSVYVGCSRSDNGLTTTVSNTGSLNIRLDTNESVNALTPTSNSNKINNTAEIFSCNAAINFGRNITGMTFNLFNASGLLEFSNSTSINGNFTQQNWTAVLPQDQSYLWNCNVSTTGTTNVTSTNSTLNFHYFENLSASFSDLTPIFNQNITLTLTFNRTSLTNLTINHTLVNLNHTLAMGNLRVNNVNNAVLATYIVNTTDFYDALNYTVNVCFNTSTSTANCLFASSILNQSVIDGNTFITIKNNASEIISLVNTTFPAYGHLNTTLNPATQLMSKFLNHTDTYRNVSLSISDLTHFSLDKNTTLVITDNSTGYTVFLDPTQLIIAFINKTHNSASTNGLIADNSTVTNFTNTTIIFVQGNLSTGKILIEFNQLNNTNINDSTNVTWTQFYEFLNDRKKNIIESIELLSRKDTFAYFEVRTESGSPLKNAKVRIKHSYTSVGGTNYTLIGQRLTDNDGIAFFYLDTSTIMQVDVLAEGFEGKILLLDVKEQLALTKSTAIQIFLRPSSDTSRGSTTVFINNFFSNRSKNIFGSIISPNAASVKFNTQYGIINGVQNQNLTADSLDWYSFILESGTHFETGTQNNITLQVYIDDLYWGNISLTFQNLSSLNRTKVLSLPTNILDETLLRTLLLIGLLIISSMMGMIFTSKTAGFTAFMTGSIILGILNSAFLGLAGISLVYYGIKMIHSIIKE